MSGWSKGLTKETDVRIARASESKKKGYAEGRIKPSKGSLGKHWKLSTETRRKQSLSKMGMRPLAGIPQTPETIEKRMQGLRRFYLTNSHPYKGRIIPRDSDWYKNISKNFFGIGQIIDCSKENNGNWKGGISFEPYSSEFNSKLKEQIKERDNRICQLCGVPECECTQGLSVHHIDYNKKNSNPSNLITLCHRCNSKANSFRNKWREYFTKLMLIRTLNRLATDKQGRNLYLVKTSKEKRPYFSDRGIIG